MNTPSQDNAGGAVPARPAMTERLRLLYGEDSACMEGADPGTIAGTWRLIRSDLSRLRTVLAMPRSLAKTLFLMISPPFVAMFLHRWAHYWHVKGLTFLSWPLWALNIYVTGADITPSTSFGHSAYLPHPNGVIVSAVLGNRCTVFGHAGIGGGRGDEDVGGGPGLPVLGNDVEVGHQVSILGPVRIGDGVTIGAHVLQMTDVPAGATVSARSRSMVIATREPGDHSGRILH